MLRILNVNSYYFSSSIYKPMEQALQRRQCEITTYVPLSKDYEVREECKYDKNPDYLDIVECYNKNDRIFFHLKHNKIKKDFLNRYNFEDYQMLHAHSLFSNGYIAYCAYKRYGIPYIVAVRNTDMNLFFKKLIYLRNLGNEILKNASKVVFLSEPYKKSCINNYVPMEYRQEIEQKSIVIPNGIDEFWIRNKLKEEKIRNQQTLNLLFVGKVTKSKNLEKVLEACKILAKKNYNPLFTVVGKIMDKKIEAKLRNSAYTNIVNRVDKEELIQYYRKNDIFVMPSIVETFGLVYPEAMSQGLPVIYTRGQGFDGQFDEGMVGYSVDCMNANEIVKKIIDIVENYKAISNRCIKLVDHFNWDRIAADYMNIYEKIIE